MVVLSRMIVPGFTGVPLGFLATTRIWDVPSEAMRAGFAVRVKTVPSGATGLAESQDAVISAIISTNRRTRARDKRGAMDPSRAELEEGDEGGVMALINLVYAEERGSVQATFFK